MGSIVCLLPPFWQTQSQQQPTAGSWQKLGPAPPRRHTPACTSSPGPPATMALPAALATAAAGLQGALLGHLGNPCRVNQGLGDSP